MKPATATMREFYRAYWAWLGAGAPVEHHTFLRQLGLCGNAERFGVQNAYVKIARATGSTMPFNEGSSSPGKGLTYYEERTARAMHLNPARIQWIKDHK